MLKGQIDNMNKKQKSSIIIASLASIAVAGSLIAGSTYALFTSESKTNIAVTSGKVKVTAVVKDLLTYTGDGLTGDSTADEEKIKLSTDYGLENGYFKNGGTASYNDVSGTLTLDKMTPGDKVTFTINVTNESTVNVKYRTVLKAENDDDLFAGLKVTIDGTSYDGSEVASAYSNLFPGSEPDDINVSIELPSDADDTYQGKSCSIVSTVEAIQGNAHLDATSVESKAELNEAIESGEPVYLSNDIDFEDAISVQELASDPTNVPTTVHSLTVYGNGKTLKASDASRVVQVNDRTDDFTLTLVDVNIEGKETNGDFRGITLYGNKNVKIVLDNCTVTANHYPFTVADNNVNVEIVAKHSTFVGYSAFQTLSPNTKATFTDCSLKGVNQWGPGTNYYATIVVECNASNSALSFNKCAIEATEAVENYGENASKERLIKINAASTFNFSACTFKHNGVELSSLKDYKNNSNYIYYGTSVNSNEVTIIENGKSF